MYKSNLDWIRVSVRLEDWLRDMFNKKAATEMLSIAIKKKNWKFDLSASLK